LTDGSSLYLDKYELEMFGSLVMKEDIKSGFEDIGGLQDNISEVMDHLILPLKHPDLLSKSSLTSIPLGFLFVGPPGRV